MNTITLSPKRQLEAFIRTQRGETRAHGAFSCGFGVGQRVCRRDDERHVGVVRAVISGYVKVIWDDTGWFSMEYPTDLM